MREGQQVTNYLEKNSNAYYEYYNPKNGTVAVNVNNENRKCAEIYYSSVYGNNSEVVIYD